MVVRIETSTSPGVLLTPTGDVRLPPTVDGQSFPSPWSQDVDVLYFRRLLNLLEIQLRLRGGFGELFSSRSVVEHFESSFRSVQVGLNTGCVDTP